MSSKLIFRRQQRTGGEAHGEQPSPSASKPLPSRRYRSFLVILIIRLDGFERRVLLMRRARWHAMLAITRGEIIFAALTSKYGSMRYWHYRYKWRLAIVFIIMPIALKYVATHSQSNSVTIMQPEHDNKALRSMLIASPPYRAAINISSGAPPARLHHIIARNMHFARLLIILCSRRPNIKYRGSPRR